MNQNDDQELTFNFDDTDQESYFDKKNICLEWYYNLICQTTDCPKIHGLNEKKYIVKKPQHTNQDQKKIESKSTKIKNPKRQNNKRTK